ncbi:hypothetical protein U9M48_016614 [Paspalum notatum var. saurae]|uniref:Uncharacterized protein n=1 Tax=Paspalum notatum var. saurae TaxID=547442 RepID=A0AAQ3WMR7_PASNO
MKKAATATLLLALVVAAATVTSASSSAGAAAWPDDESAAAAVGVGGRRGHGHGRHHSRPSGDDGGRRSPLAGLTECVAGCGSGVTTCMLNCYQPLIDFDPVRLPVCLLACTNDAMVCASGCAGRV